MLAIVRSAIGAYGAMLLAPQAACVVLLAATLVQPVVGLAGLLGLIAALTARRLLGIPALPGDLDLLNATLVGATLATFYPPDPRLVVLLLLVCALVPLVCAVLRDRLGQTPSLPLLSLPSILSLWVALPVAALLLPPAPLSATRPSLGFGDWADTALVAFGATMYSPHIVSGACVLLALALTSRVLLALGCTAYALSQLLLLALAGTDQSPLRISVGANAILTAVVTGGLLMMPALRNLLVVGVAVVVSTLLTMALSALFALVWMPVLSLPFVLASYVVLGAFRPHAMPRWSNLWLPAPALPEHTLATERLRIARGFATGSVALGPPFEGTWHVYQGIDGEHTHRGPWRHAVDFHQLHDGRAFRTDGTRLEDYVCFGAPVLSPVFGTITAVRDDVPDNPPGEVNLVDNWGNHVVIALAGGGYVLLAHLQRGSARVRAGTPVAPGAMVGRCGNSGRSPQPHLHMHVQAEPWLGAATLPFHLTHVLIEGSPARFSLHHRPEPGQVLRRPVPSPALAEALRSQVGRFSTYSLEGVPGRARAILSVELGLTGAFRLRSDQGATVGLVQMPGLLALHSREEADPVLDAYALALGLTPLIDGEATWRDAPPARAFAGWRAFRVLMSLTGNAVGSVESSYFRHWCHDRNVWRQCGRHRLRVGPVTLAEAATEAVMSEADGVVSFSLASAWGPAITATLTGTGGKADLGIPAWYSPLEPARCHSVPLEL